ncbi:MAG: DciA family protein [Burkholderiales bacterium]
MALPRIDNILATDSDLQPVVAKAREINALAKLCKEFLPPELASQIRPANLQGGKLVVLAANSAAAAKLKLLSGSLGDFLAKRGAKVNSVSVKVQPGEPAASDLDATRSAGVSERTFAVLSELYESLADSPARQALKHLLAREAEARKRKRAPR